MKKSLSLGQRIRTLRQQKGLGQKQLAGLCGLSQPAMWRIEKGIIREPRLTVLSRFANVLGVSVDSLIGREGRESKQDATGALTAELNHVLGTLTASKRKQVLEYAHFLASRQYTWYRRCWQGRGNSSMRYR